MHKLLSQVNMSMCASCQSDHSSVLVNIMIMVMVLVEEDNDDDVP